MWQTTDAKFLGPKGLGTPDGLMTARGNQELDSRKAELTQDAQNKLADL